MLEAFKQQVRSKGKELYRPMPWRTNLDPYWVMLSEVMLQQTQVARVMEKFPLFVGRFPTVQSLADASLADVLGAWIGLGYNRRAKFLHQAARDLCKFHEGRVPADVEALAALPGIGINTAMAIAVYAFNQAHAFVETNVRTVFIHHFFEGSHGVSDKDILRLVEASVDLRSPREWYWALMDYGAWLKKEHGNLSRRSSSYTRQTKFQGSERQKRAAVLRCVVDKVRVSEAEIAFVTGYAACDIGAVVEKLCAEGFVEREGETLTVKGENTRNAT